MFATFITTRPDLVEALLTEPAGAWLERVVPIYKEFCQSRTTALQQGAFFARLCMAFPEAERPTIKLIIDQAERSVMDRAIAIRDAAFDMVDRQVPNILWRNRSDVKAWFEIRLIQWRSASIDSESFTNLCATLGHLSVLEWALDNGACFAKEICAYAAYEGHLRLLKWLHTKGSPLTTMTCAWAAITNRLNIIQWLCQQNAPWHTNTCSNAAANGHLKLLQWARQHGAPWDDITCLYAAMNGHLEILQWARWACAPWNRDACYDTAKRNGWVAVMKWIEER